MKFASTLVVLVLCALTLQLAFVNCQTDDGATDDGDTEDTGATDIENAEVSGESADNSDGSDDENEEEGVNNDDNSEADQSADNSSADDGSNSVASSTDEEDTNSGTAIEETDVVESTGDESTDVVVDATPDPPAVGTTLAFNMEQRSAGAGVGVTIYFTQMADALQMHCEVSAQAGTASASFWPDEFVEEDVEEIEEDSSGSEGIANEESGNDDSNTAEEEGNDNTPDEEANEDSSSNDDEENSADSIADESTDNADPPETDGDSETVDSVIENEEASNDSGDDSSTITDNEADNTGSETDESAANEEDEDSTAGQDRATSCSGTMPHLYLIKDTTCCSDPAQAQCASSEGKLLGCIEATGIVEHDFTDLAYYEVEAYCLAISDHEADVTFRRTPKFIAAGPSFFRTFSLFNFNSVNFLSSGTKTITSSASTGSISINYPSPSTNYGGSYTPGILDTLPHIRLEGLTADHVYVVIALLMLTYLATIFFPLLNLGPLLSGISGPFSRMGDFASEKMDVIADKVRASIRSYNRRYYNNVRRVDYDANYEYYDDDEDYYYYVK